MTKKEKNFVTIQQSETASNDGQTIDKVKAKQPLPHKSSQIAFNNILNNPTMPSKKSSAKATAKAKANKAPQTNKTGQPGDVPPTPKTRSGSTIKAKTPKTIDKSPADVILKKDSVPPTLDSSGNTPKVTENPPTKQEGTPLTFTTPPPVKSDKLTNTPTVQAPEKPVPPCDKLPIVIRPGTDSNQTDPPSNKVTQDTILPPTSLASPNPPHKNTVSVTSQAVSSTGGQGGDDPSDDSSDGDNTPPDFDSIPSLEIEDGAEDQDPVDEVHHVQGQNRRDEEDFDEEEYSAEKENNSDDEEADDDEDRGDIFGLDGLDDVPPSTVLLDDELTTPSALEEMNPLHPATIPKYSKVDSHMIEARVKRDELMARNMQDEEYSRTLAQIPEEPYQESFKSNELTPELLKQALFGDGDLKSTLLAELTHLINKSNRSNRKMIELHAREIRSVSDVADNTLLLLEQLIDEQANKKLKKDSIPQDDSSDACDDSSEDRSVTTEGSSIKNRKVTSETDPSLYECLMSDQVDDLVHNKVLWRVGDIAMFHHETCIYLRVEIIKVPKFSVKDTDPPSYQVKFLLDGTKAYAAHFQLYMLPSKKIERAKDAPTPVDMLPSEIQYNGLPFITPPNVLAPGDDVFWQYGLGSLSEAKIETLNNAEANGNQLYQIRLKNGGSHQVCHKDLYLSKTALDRSMNISTTGPQLDGVQRLTQQAHPDWTAEQIVRWDGMSLKKIKLRDFNKSLGYEVLNTGTPLEMIRFYDSLIIISQAAHSEGLNFWPPIESLHPTFQFAEYILAPEDYPKSQTVRACYVTLGMSLKNAFLNPKFSRNAPNITQVITRLSSSSVNDGFILLAAMLRSVLPHLGSVSTDYPKLVSELTLANGDDIYKFLQKAMKIQTVCTRCKVALPPNALIKQVISQINRSPSHRTLIQHITVDFVKHCRQFSEATSYFGYTPATISDELEAIDAPINVIVRKNSILTPSSLAPSILDDPDPTSSAQQLRGNDSDDDTDQDERIAHLARKEDRIEDDPEFIQALHALRTVIKKKNKAQRGYLKSASSQQSQTKSPTCDFCYGKHDTDACQRRGPAFWSPEHAKNVAKFNLMHGDKPSKPPTDSTDLPRPKQASFSQPKDLSKSQPSPNPTTNQVRFMGTEIKEVLDELNEEIDAGTNIDDLANHCLRLHSIAGMNQDGEVPPPTGSYHVFDSDDDSSTSITSFINEQVNC